MGPSVRRLLLGCVWFWLVTQLTAQPIVYPSQFLMTPNLVPRKAILNDASGTIQVFDPVTQQLIPQGPASDGSGSAFSVPAIIWIVFAFLNGVPLAVAGVRGWRLTRGASIGLAVAVCSWAAFINTMGVPDISDLLLSLIILGLYSVAFVLGFLDFGHIIGIALLGLVGGAAIGIRIVLLRPGLLISIFAVNWVIIAVSSAVGGILMMCKQRAGVTLSSASAGTFLCGLVGDLAVNKQNGISRGLRFLFDRNTSHLADLFTNGYHPPLSTIIILGASLAVTPIFAYAQHRFFPHPFDRKQDESRLSIIYPDEGKLKPPDSVASRFSL